MQKELRDLVAAVLGLTQATMRLVEAVTRIVEKDATSTKSARSAKWAAKTHKKNKSS